MSVPPGKLRVENFETRNPKKKPLPFLVSWFPNSFSLYLFCGTLNHRRTKALPKLGSLKQRRALVLGSLDLAPGLLD